MVIVINVILNLSNIIWLLDGKYIVFIMSVDVKEKLLDIKMFKKFDGVKWFFSF